MQALERWVHRTTGFLPDLRPWRLIVRGGLVAAILTIVFAGVPAVRGIPIAASLFALAEGTLLDTHKRAQPRTRNVTIGLLILGFALLGGGLGEPMDKMWVIAEAGAVWALLVFGFFTLARPGYMDPEVFS